MTEQAERYFYRSEPVWPHQRARQKSERSEGGVCWLGGRETDRAAETVADIDDSENTTYTATEYLCPVVGRKGMTILIKGLLLLRQNREHIRKRRERQGRPPQNCAIEPGATAPPKSMPVNRRISSSQTAGTDEVVHIALCNSWGEPARLTAVVVGGMFVADGT